MRVRIALSILCILLAVPVLAQKAPAKSAAKTTFEMFFYPTTLPPNLNSELSSALALLYELLQDRETKDCPPVAFLLRHNDGRSFDLPAPEFILDPGRDYNLLWTLDFLKTSKVIQYSLEPPSQKLFYHVTVLPQVSTK